MNIKIAALSFLLFPLLAQARQTPDTTLAPAPFGPLPTAGQLTWHETEMYCIIHFGANTYLDHEWGYGDEDPAIINPTQFNATRIVGAAKAGGFRGIVVVAKHHDGLCLWPTATTPHNISQSPWRGGKGDMVKEYKDACNRLGMRMGVYCSPWDRNNPEYGRPGYLAIYRQQLKELYSRYGQLFMSWHDGANGGNGYYGGAKENRNIDRTIYYDWDSTWNITRAMQPLAAIFGDVGPDVRWVGNEEGHAGETCWATYTPHAPDPGKRPANGYVISEEATEGHRDGQYWMPAECDVPLRPGWFYHAAQDAQVKTPAQLLDLYYASVGRGAGLDLGLSPDKRGLLNDADVAGLKGFGDLLKATFAIDLARGARLQPSNIRGHNAAKFGPAFLLDNDRYSYWATDDSVKTPQLTIDLAGEKTFNVIRLRENIKLGQRISAFALDAMDNGAWKEIATGTSIGPNRLIRLQKNCRTKKIRLRITDAPVCIALSDFGLFLEPARLKAPSIERERNGSVHITTPGSAQPIHYTLNGGTPTTQSPVYKQPFSLVDGGTVKAVAFTAAGLPGDLSTAVYGIDKRIWDVIEEPEGSHAERAIDEDPTTNWNSASATGRDTALPAELAIDMGRPQLIRAFTYQPRLTAVSSDSSQPAIPGDGLIDRFIFYISDDGTQWRPVAEGKFDNIAANPVQQLVQLTTPAMARYFKFSALHLIAGKGVSVAEIGIISK